MPFCKNDPKKTYKGNEPSPKGLGYCAHAEDIGKIRTGLNNKKWIVSVTEKGVKRWIIYKKKNQNAIKKNKKCTLVHYWKNGYSYIGLNIRKGYIRKWIDYNLFEDKETKIPKNSKEIKLNKKTIQYYCGNKNRLEKNNDQYKAIKEKMKGYKTYFIHDNNKRPLLVYVKDNVYIYRLPKTYYVKASDKDKNDSKNKWFYIELYKKYTPKKIFIGKCIKAKRFDSDGPKSNGNSILLLLENSKYLYIGSEIYQFSTDMNDVIVKYYSSIGNNDVPYPVAVGTNNVYFMLDKKYVAINKFPKNMTDIDWTNSYDLFYFGTKPFYKHSCKIKNIKIILDAQFT